MFAMSRGVDRNAGVTGERLVRTILCVVAVPALLLTCSPALAADKPNIVYILADNWG